MQNTEQSEAQQQAPALSGDLSPEDTVLLGFIYLKDKAEIHEFDFRRMSRIVNIIRPACGPLGVFLPVFWALPPLPAASVIVVFTHYVWLPIIAGMGLCLLMDWIGARGPWIYKRYCNLFLQYRLFLTSRAYPRLPDVAQAALQLLDGKDAASVDARNFATAVLQGQTPKGPNAHLWFWSALWEKVIETLPPDEGRRRRDDPESKRSEIGSGLLNPILA